MRHVLASLLFVALSGCVATGQYETVLPAQNTYACQDGKVLEVARSPDAASASVLVDGKRIALPRVNSAAQEKYSDGTLTLYLEEDRALLDSVGRVLYGPCRSTTPLPVAPRQYPYRI